MLPSLPGARPGVYPRPQRIYRVRNGKSGRRSAVVQLDVHHELDLLRHIGLQRVALDAEVALADGAPRREAPQCDPPGVGRLAVVRRVERQLFGDAMEREVADQGVAVLPARLDARALEG